MPSSLQALQRAMKAAAEPGRAWMEEKGRAGCSVALPPAASAPAVDTCLIICGEEQRLPAGPVVRQEVLCRAEAQKPAVALGHDCGCAAKLCVLHHHAALTSARVFRCLLGNNQVLGDWLGGIRVQQNRLVLHGDTEQR